MRFLMILPLLMILSGCAGRGSVPAVVPPIGRAAERLARPGLENAARVAPGIYRGAQPTEEGLAALKALGVRTIVNLRHFHSEDEEKACARLGLAYVHFPMSAWDAPSDGDVRDFLAAVTDPALQPVFFHCQHGQDRTGTLCACYRMAVEGWSLPEALAEMDAFGFDPIWKDLRAYVEGFPPRAASLRTRSVSVSPKDSRSR